MTAPGSDSPDYRNLLSKLDREQDRVRDENEWMRIDAQMETSAVRAEREVRGQCGGQIPTNTVRWVLPANADPLAPQDPSRRAQFAQHLADIVEGAVLDQTRLQSDPYEGESANDGQDKFSSSVCGACRGSCCRSGGDEAYLTEETIVRVLQAHPDWSVSQIMDAYLNRLPAESVRDSCIYHSDQGCGLPRDLRASTCNRYLCGKLRNLRASLPATSPPAILGVMFDNGTWARTALIDNTGFKVLAEEGP